MHPQPELLDSPPALVSFAWVRSEAVLEAALCDLGALSGLARMFGSQGTLLGVWVGADTGADDPSQLPLGVTLESTSLSGLWTLMSTHELELSRSALLDALVTALGSSYERAHGRFLPVFARDADPRQRSLELGQLRLRYPRLVSAPLLQDRRSGALSWAC